MIDNETKEKFILLRAENKSYSQISESLGISIDSCHKLNTQFENKIADLKADNLQELYNAYYMTKEARIKALGSSLDKIDKAIEKADFSGIAPEKLLELKLKYSQALKDEFTPLEEIQANSVYKTQLEEILSNDRKERTNFSISNYLTDQDLKRELLLLGEIRKIQTTSTQ